MPTASISAPQCGPVWRRSPAQTGSCHGATSRSPCWRGGTHGAASAASTTTRSRRCSPAADPPRLPSRSTLLAWPPSISTAISASRTVRGRLGDDDADAAPSSPAPTSRAVAHAGDPSTLRRGLPAPAVGIAASPIERPRCRIPDLAGFGRRYIDIDPGRAPRCGALPARRTRRVRGQVAGVGVAYVEPRGWRALPRHGRRPGTGASRGRGVAGEYDPSSAILGLPGSELLRAAEAAGLDAVPEAFADRAYLSDGRLVPRRRARQRPHRPGRRRGTGSAPGDRTRGRRGRRDGRQRCAPGRSASTATRQERCSWPRPCGPGSRSWASPSNRSRDEPAMSPARGARRRSAGAHDRGGTRDGSSLGRGAAGRRAWPVSSTSCRRPGPCS